MGHPMTLEAIMQFLLDAPLFAGLEPEELARIVPILQIQRLHAGQWVFRQGEYGDSWYVVYEGRFEVLREGLFGKRRVGELGLRACFGEVAVLDGSKRKSSVRATSACTVFRLPRRPFEDLLRAGDSAALKLVHHIALAFVARATPVPAGRRTAVPAARGTATPGPAESRRETMPLVFWPAISE
jgi:CRP-like cAMP-binding protein